MLVRALKKLIPDQWKLLSKMRWTGSRWRLGTVDRVYLEDVILPWFIGREDVKSVLDIGVDWYTKSYPKLFRDKVYWTIDFDADKQRYAGASHHTLSATELSKVFQPAQFDLIICNGVFGWGINHQDDIRLALQQFSQVLRKGGWLIIGWNDTPDHSIRELDVLTAEFFQRFVLPPTNSDHFLTETKYNHRYDYFLKN